MADRARHIMVIHPGGLVRAGTDFISLTVAAIQIIQTGQVLALNYINMEQFT